MLSSKLPSYSGGIKRACSIKCGARHPENSKSDCIGSEVAAAAIKWLVVGEQEAAIRRSRSRSRRCGHKQVVLSPVQAGKQVVLSPLQRPRHLATSCSQCRCTSLTLQCNHFLVQDSYQMRLGNTLGKPPVSKQICLHIRILYNHEANYTLIIEENWVNKFFFTHNFYHSPTP